MISYEILNELIEFNSRHFAAVYKCLEVTKARGDRESNPGPLNQKSDALPTELERIGG